MIFPDRCREDSFSQICKEKTFLSSKERLWRLCVQIVLWVFLSIISYGIGAAAVILMIQVQLLVHAFIDRNTVILLQIGIDISDIRILFLKIFVAKNNV